MPLKFRPQDEIDDQLNRALESVEAGGTKWPAMSYEQGVENALRWVIGESDDIPMEDD